MANEISKKEFLKRYLENEESSRKRKKKPKLAKPKANIPCLKIVNEDIDIKSMSFGEKADDEEDDEAPVVAEVIDERPVEVKLKELYDSSRWKKIDSNEQFQSTESYEKNIKNRRHDSDDDLSPLREQKKSENVDVSLQSHKQNKKRHDSDSDFSPPRNLMQSRSKHKSDDDIPSMQSHKQSKNKYNSDSDLSPSRNYKQSRNRHNYNSDSSFQGNKKHNRHNSDSDLSPPRNQKQIRNKHNSNSGSSSQQNRSNSDSDLSPPRNHKVSSNKNLAGQQKVLSQDKNLKKQKHYSDDDLSPVREQKKHKYRHDSDSDLSPSSSRNHSSAKGKNKLDKTLSGLKAGLQNSKSLQEEVQALRNREKSQLNMLGDEISGRNAETIIRDRKTGKKRDLNKEQEIKNEEDKKNKEFLQKYEKWGKGMETRDEHIEKLKDEMHEMSKPLARYEDDADLDERLKSIIHDDDPMSAYMKKKKQKEEGVSKFPVYTGPAAPPNRFGIKPGYRWDGVDRSNGFEKKYFEKINHSKAVKDEAYLWSVQDM